MNLNIDDGVFLELVQQAVPKLKGTELAETIIQNLNQKELTEVFNLTLDSLPDNVLKDHFLTDLSSGQVCIDRKYLLQLITTSYLDKKSLAKTLLENLTFLQKLQFCLHLLGDKDD